MRDIETRNAVIEDARITNDDHGLLSAWFTLDYGGSGQEFGGYSLYLPKGFSHHNPSGPNYAGHFIWRVMEVAGVSEWSQLKGKTVRVCCEHSKVHAIGHIVKDDWFNPSNDFCSIEAARAARSQRQLTAFEQKRMKFRERMTDRSDSADAKRFRWLLAGNGYFMEENYLCGHKPTDEKERDAAREEIDSAMNQSKQTDQA